MGTVRSVLAKTTHEPRTDAQTVSDPSRRSFLNRIWAGLGILALLELAGMALLYLRPAKRGDAEEGAGAIIEAGAVAAFAPDSVTAFVQGKFYLCRLTDGGFLAVSRTCTHLGCTVPWVEKERRFACPCHGSTFDITGEVTGPPAPRALDLFALTIENDTVTVDTGRRIKRSAFRAEQVVYPKTAHSTSPAA